MPNPEIVVSNPKQKADSAPQEGKPIKPRDTRGRPELIKIIPNVSHGRRASGSTSPLPRSPERSPEIKQNSPVSGHDVQTSLGQSLGDSVLGGGFSQNLSVEYETTRSRRNSSATAQPGSPSVYINRSSRPSDRSGSSGRNSSQKPDERYQ